VQPVTPESRQTVSLKYIRAIARLIFPFLSQPVAPATLDAMAKATFDQVVKMRNDFVALAAQGYAAQMGMPSVPSVKELPPTRAYYLEDWRKAVGKAFHEYGDMPTDTVVDRANLSRTLVRADLHGRNAERNQMVAIAVHDEQIKGWARVDFVPPTCPLCRITISRGPVYTSEEAAGGDGNTYHGGCTCEVVLVRYGQEDSWPGRELYLAEQQRYKDAGGAKAYRLAVAKANEPFAQDGATKKAADKAAGN
jgi:hypothetical protein